MRTILKNFLATLRKFKLASVLNLLGMAVAFAAFTIIIMQVHYDRTFDKFHPKADRTYRMEVSSDGTKYNVLVGSKWAELIKERFPQIERIGLRGGFAAFGNYIKLEKNGVLEGHIEESEIIHPDFTEIFDFNMAEGRRETLGEPGQVFIPQSLAHRYWGNESALGKKLVFTNKSDTTLTVGGVYRDFPKNTLVKNAIYCCKTMDRNYMWDGWQFNYELFVTLSPSTDKTDIERQLLQTVRNSSDVPEWIKNYKYIRLTPLPKVFYATDVEFDSNPKGSTTGTLILLSLGLLLICIAAINFVNFAVSLTPLRVKSINTQKILGCPVAKLRLALIGESTGMSLVAFALGIIIVYYLAGSPLASFFEADISLQANLSAVIISLGIILSIGILAGLYPAFYSTRLAPALVLKGSFGLSPKGHMLRTVLIGFQYVISIGLMISAIFMQLQNRYLRTQQTGFRTDQVAVVELNGELTSKNRSLLLARLKENSQIEHVAFSQHLFGSGEAQRNTFTLNGHPIKINAFYVTSEFLDAMGIRMADGRNFRETDAERSGPVYIFNDAVRKEAEELPVGYPLQGGEVAGFIGHLNFRPLQSASDDPFAFVLSPNMKQSMPWAYVKFHGDPYAVIGQIKKAVASIDPAYPVNVLFYDEIFDNLYRHERRTTGTITSLSLMAIILSLVGVFGIVMFETQYRRKEIGVRKIFGSTTGEILVMFNKKFIIIVLVCFLIGAPLAYIGVGQWLTAFAYRIPTQRWVFAVALLIILTITQLTVTIQSYRAASENPAQSLKTE